MNFWSIQVNRLVQMRAPWVGHWSLGLFAVLLIAFFYAFSTGWAVLVPNTALSSRHNLAELAQAFQVELSEEERAILARWQVIRVGADPTWPPFSERNATGKWSGIDIEFLRVLEVIVGVRLKLQGEAENWSELLAQARKGELDLLLSVAQTPQRLEFLKFSEPYMELPSAVITRMQEPFVVNMQSLRGRVIAVPRDHVIGEAIEAESSSIIIKMADNVAEALMMVSQGEADAYIGDLPGATHVIRDMGLSNLKISNVIRTEFPLRYAAPQQAVELLPILNKALAFVPESLRQEILDRHIQMPLEGVLVWDAIKAPVFIVAGAILALIIAGITWNLLQREEIQQRKRAEQEARDAHLSIQRLVDEKNELLNMAVHDLRNPLHSILAQAEMLAMNPTENSRATLEKMATLAERMSALLDQLAAVTVLEEGRRDFVCRPVDLSATVARVVDPIKATAATKRIQLKIFSPRDSVVVSTDQLAVEQIIENLVSNAIKFSDSGKGVQLILWEDESSAGFDVTDHGPGIAPGDRPKLYTKYGRLQAKPTGGESSTGLGLAIVRHLVDGVGASVDCFSELGQGTTFKVRFPKTNPPLGQ